MLAIAPILLSYRTRSLVLSRSPSPSLLQVGGVCNKISQPKCSSSHICITETDNIFTRELRHKSEDILIKTGQHYQLNLFSGVEHGFAIRADLSKPQNKYAKEQAFVQALAWFDYNL